MRGSGGRGNRTSTVTTTFDNTFGYSTQEADAGDDAIAGTDDRCTVHTRLNNTGAGIICAIGCNNYSEVGVNVPEEEPPHGLVEGIKEEITRVKDEFQEEIEHVKEGIENVVEHVPKPVRWTVG